MLQRGGHWKLLALPKLSPDSPGVICLNRDVINQDGGSKPQARINGAVRRQACWCTGSHSLWAVRLPDNVLGHQHVELRNKLRICASNLRMRPETSAVQISKIKSALMQRVTVTEPPNLNRLKCANYHLNGYSSYCALKTV